MSNEEKARIKRAIERVSQAILILMIDGVEASEARAELWKVKRRLEGML